MNLYAAAAAPLPTGGKVAGGKESELKHHPVWWTLGNGKPSQTEAQSGRLALPSALLWERFDLLRGKRLWKWIKPGVFVFSNSSCSHLSL